MDALHGQSVDAIGTKRFDNKWTAHTCTILNLPPAVRSGQDYQILLSVWGSKFAKKKGGITRMMAGVDKDGNEYTDHSFVRELALLRNGAVAIEIPDDQHGGTEVVELEVEYQGTCGDLLGLQMLSNLPEFSWRSIHAKIAGFSQAVLVRTRCPTLLMLVGREPATTRSVVDIMCPGLTPVRRLTSLA
jgi:hypothetical protein